jgi:hypothetical protein
VCAVDDTSVRTVIDRKIKHFGFLNPDVRHPLLKELYLSYVLWVSCTKIMVLVDTPVHDAEMISRC